MRDVLARGDDRAWTMPQESRGAWSEERLAGWRTDPDVTTQLAALTSLDFSEHELGHGGVRIVSQRELLSTAQEKENQWAKENNLAHLLEHTPGLKTLIVVANTEAKFASFGLTHTHPCMLKLQMACSLCDARMQRQVIRACIVRMPCSLTTSALGRSGGDHKTV